MRNPTARIPVLLIGLLLVGLSAPAADDSPTYMVVRPTGEAHELLPKTCGVCHKDREFKFFVVAAADQEGLDAAWASLSGDAALEQAVAKPANPHEDVACLFCHLEADPQGVPVTALGFRTLDGTGAGITGVERLCGMCHPGDPADHPRVVSAPDEGAEDLPVFDLPVRDGRLQCSSCHEMHGPQAGPADVRWGYLEYAAEAFSSYPHGNRAACRACHLGEPTSADTAAFRSADPDARCTRCHREDHGAIHPPRVRRSERVYPMEFLDYPLGDDGVTHCSTCHDHVCGDDPDPRNPAFLRGGPYAGFTEFCYRCHPRGGTGALNPHNQIDERGNILAATCVFCHRDAPQDPGGGDFRRQDLLFVYSPVELCMGCHDPGPHPMVNHLAELRPDMVDRLARYQERHRVTLPLHDEAQVVCTTCHNPHQKGVLRGRAALGAGELKGWRVPSYAGMCAPCHGRMN